MRNLSFLKCMLIFLSLSIFSSAPLAQESKQIMGDPPANFYVTPTAMASWEAVSKSSQEFFFYKIFLDGVWQADVDSLFYSFESNLILGESYLAEIAALYDDEMSEKASYEFTYLPCDSFPSYTALYGEFQEGGNQALLTWTDMQVPELIELNQGYGAPTNGTYQNFAYGYGVAYDFSQYPDAVVNAIDFHHASWGVNGSWDFNIHIIDWDTKTTISTIGPFQTTGNDVWEENILLGDVSTNGAATIAILMEPLGNSPTDAYPCISGDSDPDPTGSIFANLEDINSFTPSSIGRILMDVHIYTLYGGKSLNNVNHLGSNIYLDHELIAFVPLPDSSYLIEGLTLPGFYDFCVTKVFTEDEGLHSWDSCEDELCILDAGFPEDCIAPENLVAHDPIDNVVILCWDSPNGFDPVWLQYDDGVNVDGMGGPLEFNYAAKWDPDQLEGFEGAVISKINFFPRESESVITLKIWKEENASTLIYEQELFDLEYDNWNEITLNQSIPIDISEQLWVGFYVETSGYPAGAGNYTGNPNSDLISLDGIAWEHLSDYDLPYTWNLAIFCETGKGKSRVLSELTDLKPSKRNIGLPQLGNLPAVSNTKVNHKGMKALIGYNIYRDGLKINDVLFPPDSCYHDTINYPYSICYEVTAVYELCEESDPSNEACTDFLWNTDELKSHTRIYPIPCKNFLFFESTETIHKIKVFNQLGRLELEFKPIHHKSFQVQLEKLANGIYFAEIETKSGIQTSKIIIHK